MSLYLSLTVTSITAGCHHLQSSFLALSHGWWSICILFFFFLIAVSFSYPASEWRTVLLVLHSLSSVSCRLLVFFHNNFHVQMCFFPSFSSSAGGQYISLYTDMGKGSILMVYIIAQCTHLINLTVMLHVRLAQDKRRGC